MQSSSLCDIVDAVIVKYEACPYKHPKPHGYVCSSNHPHPIQEECFFIECMRECFDENGRVLPNPVDKKDIWVRVASSWHPLVLANNMNSWGRKTQNVGNIISARIASPSDQLAYLKQEMNRYMDQDKFTEFAETVVLYNRVMKKHKLPEDASLKQEILENVMKHLGF